MKKIALIGESILHSASPAIHNFLFKQYKIAGQYNLLNITDEQLENTVIQLVNEKYSGFNVTAPYKEKTITLLDEIDETAQNIGAVNTVLIHNNKLIGYNTDCYGFLESISNYKISFNKSNALILGAGGAARAILYALQKRNIKSIYLCNRTWKKAENLSKKYNNVIAIPWSDREHIIQSCNLIVNSTTITEHFIDLKYAPKDALIYDIIYLPTAFQKHRGVINGFEMLLHQADLAFRIFCNKEKS